MVSKVIHSYKKKLTYVLKLSTFAALNFIIMKKIIPLFAAVVMSAMAYSQIKHNKFSTRIMFDQFNSSGAFWDTKVSELTDNSGYFLTNMHDDFMGGFASSIVRLDIDGNVLMDSIYTFIPNNPNGYGVMRNVVTTDTSHVALYQTGSIQIQSPVASPYLINYDLNGNIQWHFGYTNDTLALEQSKFITTQDGGYLIAGSMYDYFMYTVPPSGFAIKLDNNGNIQWSNLYGDKDTMEVGFDDVLETPDGGFFFAGGAPNFQGGSKSPNSMGYMLNLAKTDNAGNIIWSNALELGAPIDHMNDYLNVSAAMVDDTNAVVSYNILDSTSTSNFNKFAITSVNVNNGVTNWTKYYTLNLPHSFQSFGLMVTKDDKIIVRAKDDFSFPNKGVLFVLDLQGNYLNTERFTFNGHTSLPYSLINTLDGGYAYVGEIDDNEVLVVKTDKYLDPSCPDIDSGYVGLTVNLASDTSYFNFIDTVGAIPNLIQTSLSYGTQTVTSADDSLICSCSNMVSGTVLDGSVPVNGAKVFLFKKGIVPKPWAPIDSIVTNTSGTYQFNYVPTDSFLVKVEPNPTFNPNSVVSYHKHLDTCYKWESAGIFHVHCDSSSVVKDVALITPPSLTGNSSLNGYVFESTGSFSKQPGDPIPGIDITVEQSPGGIIGGGASGANGYYDLQNLSTSATYVVSIDYPGLPNDSVWTVTVNLNDTILDSLNFYIDSTGIYIIDGGITGVVITDNSPLELNVYPNPSSSNFNIQINALKPENIQVELMNELGQTIYSKQEKLAKGNNKLEITTEDYSNGLYLLKIKQKEVIYFKKLIKQ